VTSAAAPITCILTVQLPLAAARLWVWGWGECAVHCLGQFCRIQHLSPRVRLLPSLHNSALWLLGAVSRQHAALPQAVPRMGGGLVGWEESWHIIPLMMCQTQVGGCWCSPPPCLPHLAIHWAGPSPHTHQTTPSAFQDQVECLQPP
jgi:hypothetical protein